VLGRDDCPLDHEDVESGLDHVLVVLAYALRRERTGGDDALVLDLAHALHHQVAVERRLVDALHLGRRDLLGKLRDPLELLLRVLVAGEDALEVQDAEAAELAEDRRGRRRDDAVHRGAEERKLEPVRAERPADVDVVRVPGATGRNDRDVIEAVGAAALLASTDLYFHGGILGSQADERGQRSNALAALWDRFLRVLRGRPKLV